MLDQLLNGEQNQIFEIVKNFKGVSDDKNDSATSIIKDTIVSSISKQVSNGDLSTVMEMFSGTHTDASSPAAAGLSSDLIGNLTSKLGIDSGNAGNLVSQLLPTVLNMFNGKVNQAQSNGIDVASLIGQFTGGGQGNGGNLSSLLNIFNNGPQNGKQDDGFGVDDLLNIGKKLF